MKKAMAHKLLCSENAVFIQDRLLINWLKVNLKNYNNNKLKVPMWLLLS
jgi:hypothetical protein